MFTYYNCCFCFVYLFSSVGVCEWWLLLSGLAKLVCFVKVCWFHLHGLFMKLGVVCKCVNFKGKGDVASLSYR